MNNILKNVCSAQKLHGAEHAGSMEHREMEERNSRYRCLKMKAAAAWAKVESVGDSVLFFDKHGHGFSLEPNGAAELKRDCVYFMHEKRTWLDAGEYRFLCRYNMETGEVDRVVSLPDTFGDSWVVPGLCPSE